MPVVAHAVFFTRASEFTPATFWRDSATLLQELVLGLPGVCEKNVPVPSAALDGNAFFSYIMSLMLSNQTVSQEIKVMLCDPAVLCQTVADG